MGAAAPIAFAWGLVMGSFMTVVAHRVPRGESIVGPRSRCPQCGATIAAYDNVPVLSWLMLRGRSRCCGTRISARYPLTELALGLLYALTVLVLWDDPAEVALGLVFVSVLVVVTVTDLERRIIPNAVLLYGAGAGLAIIAFTDPGRLPEHVAAGVAAGALLLLAALLYPRGMGMGDVKLAAVMGLFLGRAVGPALLIALFAGSIAGIGMMIRQGAQARKAAIPFGPFLALGGVVGMLAGGELIDAYLDSFS
jgi:leader peptidase (prepilin peptidase)/N-methyltransferase